MTLLGINVSIQEALLTGSKDAENAVAAITEFLQVRAREMDLDLPVCGLLDFKALANVQGIPIYEKDFVPCVDIRQILAGRLAGFGTRKDRPVKYQFTFDPGEATRATLNDFVRHHTRIPVGTTILARVSQATLREIETWMPEPLPIVPDGGQLTVGLTDWTLVLRPDAELPDGTLEFEWTTKEQDVKNLAPPPSLCDIVEGIPTVEMARRLNALIEADDTRDVIQRITNFRIQQEAGEGLTKLADAPGLHTVLVLNERGTLSMGAIGLFNLFRRDGDPPLCAVYDDKTGKLIEFKAYVSPSEKTA